MTDAGPIAAIAGVLVSAGGTLLGVLWKRQVTLNDRQVELSRDIGKLEGHKNTLETLHTQVLTVIHETAKQAHANANDS